MTDFCYLKGLLPLQVRFLNIFIAVILILEKTSTNNWCNIIFASFEPTFQPSGIRAKNHLLKHNKLAKQHGNRTKTARNAVCRVIRSALTHSEG